MNIFEVLFYQPLYNLIVGLYHLLGDDLGLAIIAVAILSRAVLIPITFRQVKMAESSREFNEKSKEIRKKYKKDKEKQTQELMKLQQEYLPAQLGGCLPMIFQLIVFINIYSVIRNLIAEGASGFNEIAYSFVPKLGETINGQFLGGLMDLKIAPNAVNGTSLIPYIVLIIGVGIAQYSSLKILSGLRKKSEKKDDSKEKESKKKKKKDDGMEDFAEIMQKSTQQAMLVFPFMLMFISFGLPTGLSVYLITTSIFVILQQSIFYKVKERREKAENN
ncbi:membrane protein insertase YidC [Candidatus Dojkabacteria bacterium]|uniref:Membrane protein insertase YidC n=1 Tax=Candidatus Dojkabacteria bacterium TaxID=2099670 RepID=A0A955LB69_9BACT|nr:membrane protein insertase YidC [Candidatus Dojkabacteria bacterium]